jgi:hypothetical protein
LFQSPSSDHGSALDLHDTIVPACLNDLTVKTSWPKHSPDHPLIELESIRRDEWSNFKIHSVRKVLQQIQRVAVASLADHRRWPKPGPDVDHGEDPYWPFLASDHRPDLINLKFRDGESFDFAMAEPTTPGGRSFQPTMNCIPGNALGSSDGRFVQAFDAKSGDLVKDRATVLESMIRCAGC